MEQLAVRGQRRVRARACASASTRRTRHARVLLERLAPVVGDDLARAILDNPQDTEPQIARAAPRSWRSCSEALAARRRRPCRRRGAARDGGGQPRAPGRVDHRRRRLGLRHRLRRPRPRAVVGPQREHPRARHRGLLQHRRPGVEGDATRRGRQVRGRGQEHREEGPRRHRPRLRQRLRRPGRRWAPTSCRPRRRSSRPTRGPDRRWSSRTARASPTASTCRSR